MPASDSSFPSFSFLLRFENLSSQNTVRGRPDSLSLSLSLSPEPIFADRSTSSDHWSQATLGKVSTWMRDRPSGFILIGLISFKYKKLR